MENDITTHAIKLLENINETLTKVFNPIIKIQEAKQYKYFKYNKETGYLKCLYNPIRMRINIKKYYNYYAHENAICLNCQGGRTKYLFDDAEALNEALAELDEQLIEE